MLLRDYTARFEATANGPDIDFILTVIVGLVSLSRLPISEYPLVSPTLIQVSAAMVVCSWLGFFIGEKKGDAATGALIGAFVGLTYVGCLIWLAVKRNSVK